MKLRLLSLAALAILLAACNESPRDAAPVAPAPGISQPASVTPGDVDVTNRYIVVFKQWVANPDAIADEVTRGTAGAKIHFRYRFALKGFAATLPEQALDGIRRNPNVDYIEPDGIATKVSGSQANPMSWGLDRVDQRSRPLDNTYAYQNEGQGVTVYIIDTGIRPDHQEYTGRVTSGYDFVDGDPYAWDCDGHGTHVAGTVGGTNTGIAKLVNLVAVRVLNCSGSGSWSQVIAGIDWVTANHSGPSVANMSLGGGYSTSVNTAVANSIASGVVYCVAAGNNNRNACNYSPASVPTAITVGASDASDVRASFSNYGTCVDLFAPGVSITSSTMTTTTSYESWSGTSMATPHVAGVAALYLSANPTATPSQVAAALVSNATPNVLTSIGTGSPNLLLYSLVGAPPGPQPPAAPSNLTAAGASTSSINLTWTDNASNEDGFIIERATSANGTFSQIASVGANSTSYANTGLSAGSQFWYRVAAYNAYGNSSYSNTATASTLTAVHVEFLSISAAKSTNGWKATLNVTVNNANGQPQPGVTVTVSWSGGSGTAVTNSSGLASVTTGKLKSNVPSITMTVTNLSGTGYIYDNTANYCYPNTAQLSVNKP
jgi:subtilisin family serine protease